MEGVEKVQDLEGSNSNGFAENYDTFQQAYFIEQQKARRREKINSILILFIGLGALFFGIAGFIINIKNPFADILQAGAENSRLLEEQQKAELAAMQNVDTDGDGLTDYVEQQYGTSPYLADSDGDGFSDKAEIDRGTDPNCPEGQNCFNPLFDANAGTSTIAIPSLVTDPNALTTGQPVITPATLRQAMLSNGFKQEDLDQITDEELIQAFQEYAKENPDVNKYLTGDTTATATPTPTPNTSGVDLNAMGVKSLDDFKKLSGAQIRDIFRRLYLVQFPMKN